MERTCIRKAKDSIKIKNIIDDWTNNKEYLNHGVNIDELSRTLGINRTYLSNYINDTYNTNFNGWINIMRIHEAQKLIKRNPHMTLGQIALMTGYADIAHFSKQFKAHTGLTPIKWKKNNTI